MPSTAIAHIDYDAGTRRLGVTFVASGRRYVYADVPAALVADFRQATSRGRFFNARIRDAFAIVSIEEPHAASRPVVRP